MTILTEYQFNCLMIAVFKVLFWGFVTASMYALCVRGFTQYPWPEWSLRLVRRMRKI